MRHQKTQGKPDLVINAIAITWSLLSFNTAATTSDTDSDWLTSISVAGWYEIPNSAAIDVAYATQIDDKVGDLQLAPFRHITDYSSGAWDNKRNYFVLWGGGHGSNTDNGVYVFDLVARKWIRSLDPSPLYKNQYTLVNGKSKYAPADAYMPDGAPISRHTYDVIEYVPSIDRVCVFGGGGLNNFSYRATRIRWIDCFDSGEFKWDIRYAKLGKRLARVRSSVAYNKKDGQVYFQRGNGGEFASFDPIQKKWQQLSRYKGWLNEDLVSDIDSKRNRFVAIGKNIYFSELNASPPMLKRAESNVPKTVARRPGFVYYEKIDKFVVWRGGPRIYTVDPMSWTWKEVMIDSEAGDSPPHNVRGGVYGRFRYIAQHDVFIAVADATKNVFILKFDPNWETVAVE